MTDGCVITRDNILKSIYVPDLGHISDCCNYDFGHSCLHNSCSEIFISRLTYLFNKGTIIMKITM